MRIVIDLQAAQSNGSRNRGIGRYSTSLALAMARNRGHHEIIIVLSDQFPETIEPIRKEFESVLPPHCFRIWSPLPNTSFIYAENKWRRETSEILREAFLESLNPDIIHVTSLFEGLSDDALSSVAKFSSVPVAVTLYDLIPLILRKPYLENPVTEHWYLEKIDHLRRASLWLAISESARQEGMQYLNLPDCSVFNISTAADSHFRHFPISAIDQKQLFEKFKLEKPFVMYTGGIDHRKNLEGLIRAYALLPKKIRNEHQLAIVCSASETDRARLLLLATESGLEKGAVILTGFVSETELVQLYNLCKLFVFPSIHEGFGLPALEAMNCGAPVIGANTSSVPEVIGLTEALFDPYADTSIASALEKGLNDQGWRERLAIHGKVQVQKFSWDKSAREALRAFESYYASRKLGKDFVQPIKRLRLAFVSPLPPAKSGIADYGSELLAELTRYYEIDFIVNQEKVTDVNAIAIGEIRSVPWFQNNAASYDRVLYHFGNSEFHTHMFNLIDEIPGSIVLHDFFLSGAVNYIEVVNQKPNYFNQQLYHSHGYSALVSRSINSSEVSIYEFPSCSSVLSASLGVIVHSEFSGKLARRWFGDDAALDWSVIPLLKQPPRHLNRNQERLALGFTNDDFVVCSFGALAKTKLNHRIYEAWLSSSLSREKNCYLIMVGNDPSAEYKIELHKLTKNHPSPNQITITGWVNAETYQRYLAIADLAIQLRTLSRGETSAAVLDCMNYGLPTIVNANGSMADLSPDGVYKLPDEFTDSELIGAIEFLWANLNERHSLGIRAKAIIRTQHNPRNCAQAYATAMEEHYARTFNNNSYLAKRIGNIRGKFEAQDLTQTAYKIGNLTSDRYQHPKILIDISCCVQNSQLNGTIEFVLKLLSSWMSEPIAHLRIEPVYFQLEKQQFFFARKFALQHLKLPSEGFIDEPIGQQKNFAFIGISNEGYEVAEKVSAINQLHRFGAEVAWFLLSLDDVNTIPSLIACSKRFTCLTSDVYSKALEIYCSKNEPLTNEKFFRIDTDDPEAQFKSSMSKVLEQLLPNTIRCQSISSSAAS